MKITKGISTFLGMMLAALSACSGDDASDADDEDACPNGYYTAYAPGCGADAPGPTQQCSGTAGDGCATMACDCDGNIITANCGATSASVPFEACSTEIVINEISTNDAAAGDFIELHNVGARTANASFVDIKVGATLVQLPWNTKIAPGGYLVIEGASIPSGLGDSGTIEITSNGAPIDSYTWASGTTTTWGRCPNGAGAFAMTNAPTRGATNDCTTGP